MATQVTLNVITASVLRTKDTPDLILIKVEGGFPCPDLLKTTPVMSLSVTQGTGVDYVRNFLNVEPKVIHCD